MKIDFDNLQDLSDAQLMAAWHERMAQAFKFVHIQETGTKKQRSDNIKPILQLTGETGLLRLELKRRECYPKNLEEFESIIQLNLN